MAAYAALLSLFHTLDNINQHPHPPIYLHQHHLHSLTQNITFLQEFLENYPSSDTQEDDDRESRIAAAAYAAEDLIETHTVDQIHYARSTSNPGKCISSVELYEGLESVIQDMDSIRKEVAKIKFVRPQHQHQLSNSSVSPAAGGPDSFGQSSIAPVFDAAMHIKILDKLIGQESDLQIVPIVGMGGIEDSEIRVWRLVNLWVAEGILKPIEGISLEEVAVKYLKELIERNLILFLEVHGDENVKLCKMHDLVRDLCLREAQKKKLFCLVRQLDHHFPQDINMERRICSNLETKFYKYPPECIAIGGSASVTRSLLYKGQFVSLLCSRLLRVYSPVGICSHLIKDHDIIFEQANLRYLACCYHREWLRFRSLCSLLWNLQTIIGFSSFDVQLTFEIWEMPLLRHVDLTSTFVLPDPPSEEHSLVLENLQTLSCVLNFKCSEEVVKRIPNVKKLKVIYKIIGVDDNEVLPNFCLNNLDRLQKLESLRLDIKENFDVEKVMRYSVSFPLSLKKLTLHRTHLNWEELGKRIGSLPLLHFLRLDEDACVGARWETGEEQFHSLKVLVIKHCKELKYWETDSAHFPCLEILHLDCLRGLEIPSSIGDIPTLKSIELEYCGTSVGASAKRIIEEQKEYGNEDLGLLVNGEMPEEVEKHLEERDQVGSGMTKARMCHILRVAQESQSKVKFEVKKYTQDPSSLIGHCLL